MKTRRPLLASLVVSLLFFCSSACSVVLAAKGGKDPDEKILKPGSTKSEIEAQVGEPRRSEQAQAGGETINFYSYTVGKDPSTGRAAIHLVVDILTLCLWEYIAWPYEISKSGDTRWIRVVYDRSNKALEVEPATDEQLSNL